MFRHINNMESMNTEPKKYKNKRNFRKTREPSGIRKPGKHGSNFVIQKHDASSLHYDFRLNIGGTLKSWAVPKGISTAAGEKRLAIRTEDHPLDYADFEGNIPKDQYGGGTVMIWDRGDFTPLNDDGNEAVDLNEQLRNGHLKIHLQGEKIKGGYALVKIQSGNSDKQWLIIKLDDNDADARRNPVSTEPNSVVSGRSLDEIARGRK